MSVAFYVVTHSPIPKHWNFTVGPIAINAAAENDYDLIDELRTVVDIVGGILIFSSRAAASEINVGMAYVAAQTLGGTLVFEDGPGLIETFTPRAPINRATLEKTLGVWLANDVRRRSEEREAVSTAWQSKVTQERTLREENDWSSL